MGTKKGRTRKEKANKKNGSKNTNKNTNKTNTKTKAGLLKPRPMKPLTICPSTAQDAQCSEEDIDIDDHDSTTGSLTQDINTIQNNNTDVNRISTDIQRKDNENNNDSQQSYTMQPITDDMNTSLNNASTNDNITNINHNANTNIETNINSHVATNSSNLNINSNSTRTELDTNYSSSATSADMCTNNTQFTSLLQLLRHHDVNDLLARINGGNNANSNTNVNHVSMNSNGNLAYNSQSTAYNFSPSNDTLNIISNDMSQRESENNNNSNVGFMVNENKNNMIGNEMNKILFDPNYCNLNFSNDSNVNIASGSSIMNDNIGSANLSIGSLSTSINITDSMTAGDDSGIVTNEINVQNIESTEKTFEQIVQNSDIGSISTDTSDRVKANKQSNNHNMEILSTIDKSMPVLSQPNDQIANSETDSIPPSVSSISNVKSSSSSVAVTDKVNTSGDLNTAKVNIANQVNTNATTEASNTYETDDSPLKPINWSKKSVVDVKTSNTKYIQPPSAETNKKMKKVHTKYEKKAKEEYKVGFRKDRKQDKSNKSSKINKTNKTNKSKKTKKSKTSTTTNTRTKKNSNRKINLEEIIMDNSDSSDNTSSTGSNDESDDSADSSSSDTRSKSKKHGSKRKNKKKKKKTKNSRIKSKTKTKEKNKRKTKPKSKSKSKNESKSKRKRKSRITGKRKRRSNKKDNEKEEGGVGNHKHIFEEKLTTETHGEKICCHTNVSTGDVCGVTIGATYGRFDCVDCDFLVCQACFYDHYFDHDVVEPGTKRRRI